MLSKSDSLFRQKSSALQEGNSCKSAMDQRDNAFRSKAAVMHIIPDMELCTADVWPQRFTSAPCVLQHEWLIATLPFRLAYRAQHHLGLARVHQRMRKLEALQAQLWHI